MVLSDITKDRIKGCIYGQAIGDALGLGTEFMSHEEVQKNYPDGLEYYGQIIQDPYRIQWKQGSWTDDTDMMICIAKARHDNHFDLSKTARNFKDWFNGNPLGIGRHTFNVLSISDYTESPVKTADTVWRTDNCRSAANGALMRTSIVATSPVIEEDEIADICRLTHPDMRCVGSCVLIVKLAQSLIFKNIQPDISILKHIADKYDSRISEYIDLATNDDPASLSLDDNMAGYTLKTMSAALWSLWHCTSFKDCLLSIVNLGGDADTNAAVSCALSGAKYGFSNIPPYYVDKLQNKQIIEEIYTDTILDLSEQE